MKKKEKEYTHFIGVWKGQGMVRSSKIFHISELGVLLKGTRVIGCKTLWVWKIKMKKHEKEN